MVLTDVNLTIDISGIDITTATTNSNITTPDGDKIPMSWNYEADSDTTTDDEWLDLNDDNFDVVMSCENCGLDFWNVCCLDNDTQQTKNKMARRKVKKVKRMKKRRDRDFIKRQLNVRNEEHMRSVTSHELHEETNTCFRNRITMKMASLSVFERFLPRNDVISRLLRHQDKKSRKSRNCKGSLLKKLKENENGTDNRNNSGKPTGTKNVSHDWRDQCLKKLKKNNKNITSEFSDLPSVQTCLFCFHEKSRTYLQKKQKRTKKSK